MANTMFLFLFSDKSDTYINAITYAFENMQVESVRLVHVKGAKTALSDNQASTVFNQIWKRIEDLSNEGIDVYRRLNERLLDRQLVPVPYKNLKNELSAHIRRYGGKKQCLIDLTSAAKVPSIDIFSVCLALGLKSVYVFELAIKPDPSNPEASLYHSLAQDSYSYTCLSSTEAVRDSEGDLLRKTPLLWIVCLGALVIMAFSSAMLMVNGSDSFPVKLLNLAAAVVGIASPLLALSLQRRMT